VAPSSRDDEDSPTVFEDFLDSLFVGRQQSYIGLKRAMPIIAYCLTVLRLG
jgi:hypothetical protein